MSKTKQQLLARIYDDPKNYPYGFRRSGDFSIRESEALSAYGNLFNALYKGEIEPSDEEDDRIIAVMQGRVEPQTVPEKAWLKYQSRLNRPKLGSLYGNKKATYTSDEDDAIEVDDDTELATSIGSDD
ncbi:DUF413 domain-containing protein [Gayadomonas joobiniege]|uniref:DUF413 domain-containing protein n=1 Tax=Gayadomonas joobiniege TaxID=1234606 RepID=UPI0003795C3A|nr:DUF413 domain-containing protein [Gayadomonas joobiniege]